MLSLCMAFVGHDDGTIRVLLVYDKGSIRVLLGH